MTKKQEKDAFSALLFKMVQSGELNQKKMLKKSEKWTEKDILSFIITNQTNVALLACFVNPTAKLILSSGCLFLKKMKEKKENKDMQN